MTEKKNRRDFTLHFLLPVAIVVTLAIVVGCLPWSLGDSWFNGKPGLKDRLAMLGTFGDMFGFLNAVFSGVAFAAIYYTLRIQRKQHEIQESELNMKREIAKLTVDESESLKAFVTKVPGTQDRCPACYVRLVLKNVARMPARGCRVLLTTIERKRHGEQFLVIEESKLTLRLLQRTRHLICLTTYHTILMFAQ